MGDPDEFGAFGARVRAAAEAAGRHIHSPNGEWTPALIWEGRQSGVADLSPFVTSSEAKRALAEVVLPVVLGAHGAERAAMVLPAWTRTVRPGEAVGRVTDLADDPRSQEVLALLVSDGTKEEIWTAPVVRDELRPPQLGPWQWGSDQPTGVLGGALRRALRRTEETET
ncbi:MAG TPA: hypothetical protein VFD01_06165 [Candidatus Dormibacteraeota bacterium]|jgi:hypothetical protein|nr:hypothetical protein [Candidatus Dormibacteraeota bacterium]